MKKEFYLINIKNNQNRNFFFITCRLGIDELNI